MLVYISIYKYIQIYIYIYKHINIYIYIYIENIKICIYRDEHIIKYTYIYMYIYIYIYVMYT